MPVTRFLKRGLLFASPLLIWMGIVVVIDPFDYFDICHVIPEQLKVENAASLNEMMFNMLKETHHPSPYLVIGDSRVENLSLSQIKMLTGNDYHRLSSNALKLNEAIDLFWFANRRQRVARVVFGINFNQYNEFAFADRVHSVEAIIHNPLLYLFDRSVAQTSYFVFKAYLTNRKAFSSIPPMSRDEFWNYIVSVRGREHYGKYRHPDALYARMQQMVRFAKSQGTEVTFIIVPHHSDFQRRVSDFALTDEWLRFQRDMADLNVRVIDFDYKNIITTERSNFRDPLHCTDEVASLMVNEVFGDHLRIGRRLDSHKSSRAGTVSLIENANRRPSQTTEPETVSKMQH